MRNHIITTSSTGLRRELLPYRLYEKAKRLGVWNPRDIDFSKDINDWKVMGEKQQARLLQLISKFQAGEEAVTLDLLPLIMAIAREGRLEEEMFLTTFLFEEAKHTDFFRLLLDTLGVHEDLSKFHTPTHCKVFYEILPETMQRLITDSSSKAIADASVVYNMFVEGMLAETGYYAFKRILESTGQMPGLLEGIRYLQRDESRHIAYGTFLLQRLICEEPSLYPYIETRLTGFLPLALQINQEAAPSNGGDVSTNPIAEDIMAFSKKQYELRLEKLQRARTHTLDELYRVSEESLGVL